MVNGMAFLSKLFGKKDKKEREDTRKIEDEILDDGDELTDEEIEAAERYESVLCADGR